jgi:RHS repeat-associated protein
MAVRCQDLNGDGDFGDTNEFQYVTALLDATGGVIERYHYSPYGKLTVLDPDFAVDADGQSDFYNPYGYTGRRLEPVTGLYDYRNRFYHAQLGRFVNRDPEGYRGSRSNLYRYVSSNPLVAADPTGLRILSFVNCDAQQRAAITAADRAVSARLPALMAQAGAYSWLNANEWADAQNPRRNLGDGVLGVASWRLVLGG